MMYRSLQLKPEGAILSKRSKPQGTDSSPHDPAISMAERLEMSIQGTAWVWKTHAVPYPGPLVRVGYPATNHPSHPSPPAPTLDGQENCSAISCFGQWRSIGCSVPCQRPAFASNWQ